ncbi:MAG: thioredoxin domain-containing protein [Gemmatimonadales bacterium]|nr:thioredoxin domain-containing protein [Gemmatimonadales bacterium]MDZ4389837.1 thioredoxin domain-containing protein [Gemmatimonadales bacterium]
MPRARITLDTFLNVVMAGSALVVAVTFLMRGGGEGSRPNQRSFTLKPALWQDALEGGHRIGSGDAPAQLVVVADFQCPACKRFNGQVLPRVREQFGEQLAISFRHWPLAYHQEAVPAAIAAECAAEQGAFWALHDTLFAQQASLGTKPYVLLAAEAGVADTSAFQHCLSGPDVAATVQRDLELAESIGGGGTPTIILNGVVLGSGSLEGVLSEAIKAEIEKSR